MFMTSGMTLLTRMALVIEDGKIVKVFYPVFPPDKSAEEVIAWLRNHPLSRRLLRMNVLEDWKIFNERSCWRRNAVP